MWPEVWSEMTKQREQDGNGIQRTPSWTLHDRMTRIDHIAAEDQDFDTVLTNTKKNH